MKNNKVAIDLIANTLTIKGKLKFHINYHYSPNTKL